MDRRRFANAGLGVLTAALALPLASRRGRADTPHPHKVAFQINSDDRRLQEGALGNIHNYAAHYRALGEPCAIEVVAFGLGYSLVRADMSMMKGQLAELQKELGSSLTLAACHNTRMALAASEGRKPQDIPLLPGVVETPSGVVRLAELQEQGWSYIRP